MDLQSFSFAADEIYAPKQTRLLFHLPWRISVLVWALFLQCSGATLQTPANALTVWCLGWLSYGCALFSNTSVVNLCSLVLDRFIAIVHPLKYITLMTRRRITQVIFFSWGLTVSFNALKVIYYVFYFKTMDVLFIWLNLICFEFLPTVVLILCFVSMIFHVRRHDRSARIVEKQLRFNHQVSFKTHYEKSAVIMKGVVIGVFLVCYGMYLRCSFLILSSSRCNDENYKILFLVLNSAINPLAYAFFKRDIKKEFQRLVGTVF